MRQVGQIVLLCLQKILKQCACADHAAVIIGQPKPCKRGYFKVLQEFLSANLIVKIPGVQRIDRNAQPVFHAVQIHPAHIERLVADDLRRRKTIDLIHKLCAVFKFCHKIVAGGDIRHRNSVPVCNVDDTHDIIILRFVQRLGIKIGSGRHNTHHFAFYDSLSRLRIFYLLTDRHFISFGDQFIEITFHSVIWDATHGRPLFLTAVLSGQRNLQFPGCSQRVVEEHLIKIS